MTRPTIEDLREAAKVERHPPASAPKLSVVIPVFNERATIEELLTRVQAIPIEKEIIVVDDGSTDGTRELLQQIAAAAEVKPVSTRFPGTGRLLETANLRLLLQPLNMGKGAAVRRGFRESAGEIVIVQDADLEYEPEEYFKLIDPIERGRADVVYGSRFLGGPHRVLFFWHSVGNKLLTMVSNMLTNLNLSDVWTCHKAFRRDVLDRIELREDRFGFEPEVTARIARARCRIYEVPISYWGRTYAEGKKITWKDGVLGLWYVVRYNVFG